MNYVGSVKTRLAPLNNNGGALTFVATGTGVDPSIANLLFDSEMYTAGDWISPLAGGISVSPPVVFNKSNPAGRDLDLESPHKYIPPRSLRLWAMSA